MPDDLTPAEDAFRKLLASPKDYALWAAESRARWERTPEGRAATERVHGAGKGRAA
jgi:hypothetical protein